MSERGITLIEILVVIFIIALLLTILVSDFPKIQRQFALSRATYKFAQDLRKAQDMALSGEEIKKPDGTKISVKGYGVYIDNRAGNAKKYIIYADLNGDAQYTSEAEDYIVNTVDLDKDARGVVIRRFELIDNNYVSMNFNPPNPAISISNLNAAADRAGITFGLESDPENSSNTRTVYIWKSGLIEARNNETFKF